MIFPARNGFHAVKLFPPCMKSFWLYLSHNWYYKLAPDETPTGSRVDEEKMSMMFVHVDSLCVLFPVRSAFTLTYYKWAHSCEHRVASTDRRLIYETLLVFLSQRIAGAKQSRKKQTWSCLRWQEGRGGGKKKIKPQLKALGSFINLHWKLNKEFKGLMNS